MGYSTNTPRWLQNAQWFIALRWFAIILALTSILSVQKFSNITLPFSKLNLVVLTLVVINILYTITIITRKRIKKNLNFQHLRLFLNLQVAVDLMLLTLFLHYSGGIENPAIVFYIFHMVLSSILLPRLDSFLQASLSNVLFVSLIFLEYKMFIPHYTINDHLSGLFSSDPVYLTVAILIFSVTSYMVVLLTSYVTKQLREHELDLEYLNNELKEKDNIKNEYVLRLTHDIKGYVSSIKSSLDVVNLKVYGEINEQYHPFIEGANTVLNNLSIFIKELLQLTKSKLYGGEEKEIVEINDLIQSAIEHHKKLTLDKGIEIKLNIESGQNNIHVLFLSAKEMFINLLGNAIKYSPDKTSITISSEPYNKNFSLFKISDEGIGIPEDEIPKLFKEFFRATNAKSSYEGSGLGLCIVKQIILNHGGEIWVESKLNKGSTFYLTLPYHIKN